MHAAPIDEAKVAFGAGKAAFERGDYETALTEYQRANLLVPAPSLSYNIGTTYEHLGRYHDAALAFDRYLEQSGAPQSEEEKQFQDNLRARSAADRKRQDAQSPTAAPLPQPVYTPPPAYYYQPPAGPPKEVVIKLQRARRTRAIVLMSIGVALSVAGIAVVADGVGNPHTTNCTIGFGCSNSYDATNYVEDWFGATLFIVGVTLWAPGASSYVQSDRLVHDLSKPDPAAPAAPKSAMMLSSPVFRF